ncbi:ATP-binding protein [Roseibium sp. SCP14]|uniref:ATP-binding protein n=1 Tax=Roseibium sp. SCP14 TaxID=3141375 RepID=UPI003336725C
MPRKTSIDLDIEKGERRQITALFYDMAGSTTLVNNMDLEDFREIQHAIHAAAHRAITSHGGHLDLLMGDGGSAYFGYPVPDEDAPQRAVDAGLAILQECKLVQKELDNDVQVRIGIATGSAISGQAGSGALAERDEIIGIAPTLAARIQGAAKVGTVVVSNATYRATRRLYHYESLGAIELKGFPQHQALWQPLSRRNTGDRFEMLRDSAQPFLARKAELEVARAKWRDARDGRGQVFYVHGEAGIGKSRLCHQIMEKALKESAHLLEFQCEPSFQDTPYYPIVKSLRTEIKRREPGFDFHTPSAKALKKILKLPGVHPIGIYEALAFLLSPLQQSPATEEFEAPKIADSAVSLMVDAVMAVACEKPCVIKLEDLHWADSQTLEFLEQLLDRVSSAPVLVVVSSREAPGKDWHKTANFTAVALSRLNEDSILELVQNFAGATTLPPRLANAIATRCEGVPLFAEELTRFVLDRGAETDFDETAWEKLFESDETANLQDLLAARLGTLGPAKFVAQAASVIGRSFNILTLVALLASTGAQASADEALDRLVSGGFIEEQSSELETSYRFRHSLLQQAAYSGLLRSNRRTLHTALYHLAVENGNLGHPFTSAELAGHAEEAQLPLEAVHHYIDAARKASIQSALKEAKALLNRARQLTDKLKDEATSTELELEILKLLGPVVATMDGTGSEEASTLYSRGVELLHEVPYADRATGFPLYWGYWFTAGNFKIQRERAELLLTDLAGSNNREVELQAHHCRWATAFNTGNHKDCLDAISKGLELYSEEEALEHRTRYGGHDARVCGLGEKALSSWFIGQTETSVKYMEEADDWARHIDHVGSNCHALDIGIMLYRYRADIDQVANLARRMHTIAGEYDLKSLEAKSLIFAGWADGMAGDPARGRAKLSQGLTIQREIGTEEDFPVYLEMAGELDGQLGQWEDGTRLLASAIERAEEAGHAFWLAELYRRRARLYNSIGHREMEVSADLSRADEVAARQSASVLVLRALTDRIILLPDKVTPGLIDRTRDILEDLEAGPEQDRAKSLLSGILG